jgi:hypothetical protein
MPWHMMQRRKNRSACFDAEEDDRFSLDRMTELSQEFGCAVQAGEQENRGQTRMALPGV